MKKLIVLASMVLSSAAHADLLTCTAESGETLKVSSKVMVISDASIGAGKKTTARFTAENGTLAVQYSGEKTVYVGNVDLRFNDSKLAGRNLFGTKLGEIDTIEVALDEQGEGTVRVAKRNGAVYTNGISCQ